MEVDFVMVAVGYPVFKKSTMIGSSCHLCCSDAIDLELALLLVDDWKLLRSTSTIAGLTALTPSRLGVPFSGDLMPQKNH